MNDGRWVKEYEKITEWEWYKKPLTAHLFRHLILKAQYKESSWQGWTIPKGCVVTTRERLVHETGLTEREVRTALGHLAKTGEVTNITREITGKKMNFTVYRIENYSRYQANQEEKECQKASNAENAQEPIYMVQTDATDADTVQRRSNEGPTKVQRRSTYKKDRNTEVNNSIKDISSSPSSKLPKGTKETQEIIDYWNANWGTKFQATTKTTIKSVQKLIEDGHSLAEIKQVIDWKGQQAERNPKEKKWFTPSTLFRPENFQRASEWMMQDQFRQTQFNPWANGQYNA